MTLHAFERHSAKRTSSARLSNVIQASTSPAVAAGMSKTVNQAAFRQGVSRTSEVPPLKLLSHPLEPPQPKPPKLGLRGTSTYLALSRIANHPAPHRSASPPSESVSQSPCCPFRPQAASTSQSSPRFSTFPLGRLLRRAAFTTRFDFRISVTSPHQVFQSFSRHRPSLSA